MKDWDRFGSEIEIFARDLFINDTTGESTHTHYTAEMTAPMLDDFRADGWTLPEDITPENLADALNDVITDYLASNSDGE